MVGWGGSSQRAHREAYWTSFVVHTGVPLREDVWHGGIGVLRTKVQGGATDWDVVQVEVEELLLGCEEGLFEPIDWQMLGGREQYIDVAVHDCGVGAMVWSQLFGYDAARMREGPRNWAEFWDVQRFPGRRGMRRTPKYTLEFALMADGVAPADVYKVLRTPEGVDRAFRKLDAIKPHMVWWSSISQVPDLLGLRRGDRLDDQSRPPARRQSRARAGTSRSSGTATSIRSTTGRSSKAARGASRRCSCCAT